MTLYTNVTFFIILLESYYVHDMPIVMLIAYVTFLLMS